MRKGRRLTLAGSLQCRAGNGTAVPFPAPLSRLVTACLRFAPDRPPGLVFHGQAEHFSHNQKATVATLRLVFGIIPECCSASARNGVRLPSGMLFDFAGIRTGRRRGRSWGLCPQTPGIYRFRVRMASCRGGSTPPQHSGTWIGARVASLRCHYRCRSGVVSTGAAAWPVKRTATG